MFQNNVWNFIRLLWTALMLASEKGYIEIVKMLLDQNGIEINAKNVYLI